MTQITLKLEDSLVESIGAEQIEGLVQEWLYQYTRRQAFKEAAEELSTISLTNDPQWKVARNLAWETYKHNFEQVAL
jgi:hypothetical protein